MKHVARRGVCIGVDRHLKAGDPVPSDLDAAQVQFLVGIGAAEAVPEEPQVEPVLVEVSVVPQSEPAEPQSEPAEPQLGLGVPKPETGKKKK